MLEPPGIFLGRGDHPKTGTIKLRIKPESVTINIGKGEIVPEPPEGHKWKQVINNVNGSYIASYDTDKHTKYILFGSTSFLRGKKDIMKYEKARKLKTCIEKVRENYFKDMDSNVIKEQQRGVAIYLIDKLAIRCGNEKKEDEADTVGCCSLRKEHIKLRKDGRKHIIELDFLGKDSMRYQNTVEIHEKPWKCLKTFISGKKPSEEIFDELTTTYLNDFLKSLMDGLTAKVFRTYNASLCLQNELNKTPKGLKNKSVEEKLLCYNNANRQVAILCNHQRSVKEEVFNSQMGRIKQQLLNLKQLRDKVMTEYKKLSPKEKRF